MAAAMKQQLLSGGVVQYPRVWSTCLQVRQSQGLAGFFTGSLVNVQRAALINGVWISCYDHAKQMLKPWHGDSALTTILASQVTGVAATVVSAPIDIVRTRMMAQQSSPTAVHYRNSLHCLSSIVRHEGVQGLFKGLVPGILRGNLWSASFFLIYEQLSKQLLGQAF
eukprot:TRINITY_DN5078_c0_g1_i4.p1 TRINITY_DN5078_c0_g1~~TRINITY_DN5078_c0_g1_i4.p1  ORF type:complete len:167 (-),score=22.41 TRINITY_DN5078_c0_g1_i4:478-978(-)